LQAAGAAGGDNGALAPLEVAAVCRGHTDAVESLAASPAGDLCASGSWDATLRVWRTGGAPETPVAPKAGAAPCKNVGAGRFGICASVRVTTTVLE